MLYIECNELLQSGFGGISAGGASAGTGYSGSGAKGGSGGGGVALLRARTFHDAGAGEVILVAGAGSAGVQGEIADLGDDGYADIVVLER